MFDEEDEIREEQLVREDYSPRYERDRRYSSYNQYDDRNNRDYRDDGRGTSLNVSSGGGSGSIMKYIIGAVIIYFIIRRLFGNPMEFQDDAEINDEVINDAVDNMRDLSPKDELAGDTSPMMFKYDVLSEDLLEEDIAMGIVDRFSTKINDMASNINVPLDDMLSTVAQVMMQNMMSSDLASVEFSDKAVELYLDHLDIWLPIYMQGNEYVFNKTAELAEELMGANIDAQSCTQTLFVKKVQTIEDETSERITGSIAVTKATGGFLGMNKQKTTEEMTTITDIMTSRTDTTVSYIPHCTSWGLTTSALLGNITAFTLGLSATYSFFQTILDACPDVNQYLRAGTGLIMEE